MSLSSLHLDAFVEVLRCQSFSAAARALHVTQSALSQRILNLEQDLGAPVFIRNHGQISLTSTGERLLVYCRSRDALESEFLLELRSGVSKLMGRIAIASFSTHVRSVLLPKMAQLGRDNPDVQFEIH